MRVFWWRWFFGWLLYWRKELLYFSFGKSVLGKGKGKCNVFFFFENLFNYFIELDNKCGFLGLVFGIE